MALNEQQLANMLSAWKPPAPSPTPANSGAEVAMDEPLLNRLVGRNPAGTPIAMPSPAAKIAAEVIAEAAKRKKRAPVARAAAAPAPAPAPSPSPSATPEPTQPEVKEPRQVAKESFEQYLMTGKVAPTPSDVGLMRTAMGNIMESIPGYDPQDVRRRMTELGLAIDDLQKPKEGYLNQFLSGIPTRTLAQTMDQTFGTKFSENPYLAKPTPEEDVVRKLKLNEALLKMKGTTADDYAKILSSILGTSSLTSKLQEAIKVGAGIGGAGALGDKDMQRAAMELKTDLAKDAALKANALPVLQNLKKALTPKNGKLSYYNIIQNAPLMAKVLMKEVGNLNMQEQENQRTVLKNLEGLLLGAEAWFSGGADLDLNSNPRYKDWYENVMSNIRTFENATGSNLEALKGSYKYLPVNSLYGGWNASNPLYKMLEEYERPKAPAKTGKKPAQAPSGQKKFKRVEFTP